MKKSLQIFFFFSFFFFLLPSFCLAQPYWNSWINFSQKYYKIPVVQNGIYRLDSLTLSDAGIPISTIDPRTIQLFFRGQEQYIYIKGQTDGMFNSADYIEFYGQKNDGALDSTLYTGVLNNMPVRQPNPYYSLFNDTSAYFLTWNNSSINKRITDLIDTAYSLFSPTAYFMKEQIVENHTNYYYGETTPTNIQFPEYDEVEGWSSVNFYQGNSYSATFNSSNIYSLGPEVHIKLAVMGVSNDVQTSPDHIIEVKYKNSLGNFTTIDNISFDGYQLFDPTYLISASNFGTSTDVIVSALTGSFSTSRNAVPYVVMKFPHTMNLANQSYCEMYVPENSSQSKSFFTFTNFNDLGSSAYLYDLTNNLRIPITKNGTAHKVLVSNAASLAEKFCIVKSENQFLSVLSIKPVRGTGFFTDYSGSAFAKDSVFLIITHKNLISGANAYQNYRASTLGGSHNVMIAYVDELYDQFGYGIPKHPFAIRNFAEFCADNFPSIPGNLFLLGKSVQTNLGRNKHIDPTGNNYANSLVPSIAYPTSDIMLVSGLNGNLLKPIIPIGRLAAKNNTEITTYLNKVDQYEHPPLNPEEWMKQIIHMGGGANQSQQQQFAAFLKGYERIIEDTSFGGHVHAFSKNTSSPTQTSYTDSIRGLINKGVSLITFFGHSGSMVFDLNLLPPDQYSNTNGKYPFFFANGCTAGDIHQPPQGALSSSELYIFSNKGMIGFLATSGPGTPYELNQYSSFFYKEVGGYLYGKSVGRCIQATIDTVEGSGASQYMNATCLEMTLHGDPSIVIHSSKLPDYTVNNSSVFFNPPYVSTDLDSFDVKIIITNIGKATYDSVKVDLKRTFVDGTSVSYSNTIPNLFYKDTLTIRVPVDPIKGPGLNKFELRVDPFNSVSELEDIQNNNILAPNEVPLLIYSGDIIPVYPYEYAIVPNDTITLKAYTSNPFAALARYIFEVDTTDLFNSPQKKVQYVTQRGAVVKALFNLWSPSPLVLSDSTVYFWRVRRDTNDIVNFRWRESSFQYVSNKRGWGQSHFFQFFKGNKYSYIDTNRIGRNFDFERKTHTLEVRTSNTAANGNPSSPVYFFIDGQTSYLGSWISDTIPHVIVSVLDPVTGLTWINNGKGPYGSYVTNQNSGQTPLGDEGFEFYTRTIAEQDNLRRFLKDTIPCGSKVVVFTSGNHNLGDLLEGSSPFTNPGLIQAFQSIGSTLLSNIQNNLPYILVGRKCGVGVEKIADSARQTIFVYDTLSIKRESGYIYSETIGPASKWQSMHWRYVSPEQNSDPGLALKDTMKITIVGIKNNGTADTLFKNISKDSLDIYNLDASISATTYPYLQLLAWVKDSIKRTPAQLKKWQIYYDGVPDASLNPSKNYSFYNSVIQQADTIKMTMAIENIGDYNMDSLRVDFWVYDVNRNKIPIKSVKLDSLLMDSILIGNVTFSTINIPGGLNSLWIEANPFNSEHQLEQYSYNNIAAIPFTVIADAINPMMDVTFDRVHIMNGDIVSAKPAITIRLKDENTFLALNDTSAFEVFLKYPSKNVYDRIFFGNTMTFIPASLPNNSCQIDYTPSLVDGTYDFKVQSKDRTGNTSGNVAYQISFEVINKPTVTNVLNYPNPFSTSTRFVFTLTGSEPPEYFKIQILTITGKIVKEIDKHQLGSLHIGNNITEYAWDGKDEFGDQLANGLYLYRVMTQLNGKSLEHRESNMDSFFTRGFGKMYLIR